MLPARPSRCSSCNQLISFVSFLPLSLNHNHVARKLSCRRRMQLNLRVCLGEQFLEKPEASHPTNGCRQNNSISRSDSASGAETGSRFCMKLPGCRQNDRTSAGRWNDITFASSSRELGSRFHAKPPGSRQSQKNAGSRLLLSEQGPGFA